MRYEIGYQPSYSLAILQLEPGEEIRCESGAMVSMSGDLVLEAKMNTGGKEGGFLGNALSAITRANPDDIEPASPLLSESRFWARLADASAVVWIVSALGLAITIAIAALS